MAQARTSSLLGPLVNRTSIALIQACRILLFFLCYALVFSAILRAAAAAYTVKRSLGLDIVSGVDMLPDPEIEAMIQFVISLFGK
jgi:hypothetical protein